MKLSWSPFLSYAFKKELVDFFKNTALMVQSGIPLNEALGVLAAQTRRSAFRRFLLDVKRQVERGTSFSKSLEPYRAQFGDLALNIIRAGEINGTLEANLQYISFILTRNRDLRQRVSSALLYPEIVLAMTVFLGGGIAIFILPKLIPLFTALHVELPLATRILMAVSIFFRDHGTVAVFGSAGVLCVLFAIRRLPGIRWVIDGVEIHAPFFGQLIRNYQLALFSRIFGTLFRSGLTIREALVATADAMPNTHYRLTLHSLVKRLSAGTSLSLLLARHKTLFPDNVLAIVSVGEKSGKLDESFTYLAEYYDSELDIQTKRLPTLIEPLLLLVIGAAVAFVAMAVISPIYDLTSSISASR